MGCICSFAIDTLKCHWKCHVLPMDFNFLCYNKGIIILISLWDLFWRFLKAKYSVNAKQYFYAIYHVITGPLPSQTCKSHFSLNFCPLDSLLSFSFGSYSFVWPWDVLFKCPHTLLIANYILKGFWLHFCSLQNLSPAMTLTGLLELGENFCKWHFPFWIVSLNGIFDELVITPVLLICKVGGEQETHTSFHLLIYVCKKNFSIDCFPVRFPPAWSRVVLSGKLCETSLAC